MPVAKKFDFDAVIPLTWDVDYPDNNAQYVPSFTLRYPYVSVFYDEANGKWYYRYSQRGSLWEVGTYGTTDKSMRAMIGRASGLILADALEQLGRMKAR